MPRKTLKQAEAAAIKEGLIRLRLLIRNHEFRKDLVELRKLDDPYACGHASMTPQDMEEAVKASEVFESKKLVDAKLEIKFPDPTAKPISTYWDLLRKWDLQWFPSTRVKGVGPLPGKQQELESELFHELMAWKADPELKDMWRPAVIAREPCDEWREEVARNWDGTDQAVQVPDHIPGPGRVLRIEVDLSYPQDVVEAAIKKAVREAKERRRKLQDKGILPARPERLRLDTIDFQLKVYDLRVTSEPIKPQEPVTRTVRFLPIDAPILRSSFYCARSLRRRF